MFPSMEISIGKKNTPRTSCSAYFLLQLYPRAPWSKTPLFLMYTPLSSSRHDDWQLKTTKTGNNYYLLITQFWCLYYFIFISLISSTKAITLNTQMPHNDNIKSVWLMVVSFIIHFNPKSRSVFTFLSVVGFDPLCSSGGRGRDRRQRHGPFPAAALWPRGPGGRVWEGGGWRPSRHCNRQSQQLRVWRFHHSLPQPPHAGVCQAARLVYTQKHMTHEALKGSEENKCLWLCGIN